VARRAPRDPRRASARARDPVHRGAARSRRRARVLAARGDGCGDGGRECRRRDLARLAERDRASLRAATGRATRAAHPPPAAGAPRAGSGVPAELRDLPDEKPLDLAAAVTRNGTAMHGVAGAAIAGDVLYALTVERAPDDTNGGGVVRLDLATRAWRWHRADGC